MRNRSLLSALAIFVCVLCSAQVRIWEGTACRNRSVTLTAVLPDGEPKASVVICPGGSYYWHDRHSEGLVVARWLASEGIAAYVLNYRVAGVGDHLFAYRTIFRGHRHPDMICDLQRAIELVRGENGGLVGVMGFSAGGHLALSSGALAPEIFLERYGIAPGCSVVPDFIASIYPVVTFSDERYVHRRSRRGALGRPGNKDASLCEALSIEKRITPGMPPVFIANCKDDDVVDYHNSALLDSALTEAGVRHEWILYEHGGHGFGANPEKLGEETGRWMESFLKWLQSEVLEKEF